MVQKLLIYHTYSPVVGHGVRYKLSYTYNASVSTTEHNRITGDGSYIPKYIKWQSVSFAGAVNIQYDLAHYGDRLFESVRYKNRNIV